MEAILALPLVVALVALARTVHLRGWKGLMNGDFQPRVPLAAKYGLVAFLVLQLGVGLLFPFQLIEASLARLAFSPVGTSLVVSLLAGWIVLLNWTQGDHA